jgi:hypothetical protein
MNISTSKTEITHLEGKNLQQQKIVLDKNMLKQVRNVFN